MGSGLDNLFFVVRAAEIRGQNYRATEPQARGQALIVCYHDSLRRNGAGAKSMAPSIDPTSLQRSANLRATERQRSEVRGRRAVGVKNPAVLPVFRHSASEGHRITIPSPHRLRRAEFEALHPLGQRGVIPLQVQDPPFELGIRESNGCSGLSKLGLYLLLKAVQAMLDLA